jgi:hypothetical protein
VLCSPHALSLALAVHHATKHCDRSCVGRVVQGTTVVLACAAAAAAARLAVLAQRPQRA